MYSTNDRDSWFSSAFRQRVTFCFQGYVDALDSIYCLLAVKLASNCHQSLTGASDHLRKLALIKSQMSAEIVSSAQVFVPLFVLLMTHYSLKYAFGQLAVHGELVPAIFLILILSVTAGWSIRYSSLPVPFARLYRLISLALLCYLLIDPADFTVVQMENAGLARQIAYGYWAAVFFGGLSLYRPAALLFPAFYISLLHASSIAITGFSSDRLASVTLLESAQFLSFSVLALSGLRRISRLFIDRAKFRLVKFEEMALGCMFIAISLHFSHYFWSGYEKLNIGEYLWTWARDNQTQNLILTALYRGTLPSASSPVTTQWLYDQLSGNVQWMNVLSASVQILAIAAFLHVLAIRVLSVLYDALHIGIYLATGLLLWPWVANNIAILYALKGVGQPKLTWPIKLVCLIAVTLGGFQYFGNASRLAWWDMKDITGAIVQAQGGDAQWRDVPLSYFNSHGRFISLEAGQTQLAGHYSPTGWGATRVYDLARMRGECEVPSEDGKPAESDSARVARENRIKAFLLAHHRKLLAREERFADSHPYPGLRYLHSATYLPEGIDQVSQIDAYRFVMQSVCLDLVDGELQTNVIKEDSFIINVEPAN